MKAYSVSVKFMTPNAGILTVAADNEDLAKQKVKTLLADHVNVEFTDVVELTTTEPLLQDVHVDIPSGTEIN